MDNKEFNAISNNGQWDVLFVEDVLSKESIYYTKEYKDGYKAIIYCPETKKESIC